MNLSKSIPEFPQDCGHLAVASILINLLGLAIPITLMQVYDRIIPNESVSTLLWLMIGCFVFLIFEFGLRLARFYVSNWMSMQFDYNVGMKAVEKILLGDLKEYEKEGFGVHLESLNSIGTLRGYYSGQTLQMVFDLPFALFFIFAIMYLEFHLAFIPLILSLVFIALMFIISKKFKTARNDNFKNNDRRFGFIIQIIAGIHSVVASAMEEQMLRRYESLQYSDTKAKISADFWSAVPNALGTLFSFTNLFLVICMGSYYVINDQITVGSLTACSLLAGRAWQPVQQLANFLLRLSDVNLAEKKFERLDKINLRVPHGTPKLPKDIEGSIEVRDVSFRYSENLPYVLKNANLKILQDQMVGITSPGSNGTTTLLFLMMGILNPEKGIVFIGNNNLAKRDLSSLQSRIEYLPPSAVLLKGTIMDNITMFDKKNTLAAYDAASMLGLDDLVSQLSHGYETMVDSRASKVLPSALVQRISIARALIVRPRILFLDKTDESMDVENSKLFHWLIGHLKGNCTLVFVTNNKKYLSMADANYELINHSLARI